STRRFISTSAEALVVVSELYCTTSKPSGLASVQTLRVAACTRTGVHSSAASNRRMRHSLVERRTGGGECLTLDDLPGAEYLGQAPSGRRRERPRACRAARSGWLAKWLSPAVLLVALLGFWYKAALFCRGLVLVLCSAPGKTLEKRGAERQGHWV